MKYADFENLNSFRTIFFNGPVTIMVETPFNLQYYRAVNVSIVSPIVSQPVFEASLCQTNCQYVETTLQLDFEEVINNMDTTRCYLVFPGFSYPKIPALFVLSGTLLNFTFMPVMDTPSNLTIKLHIFRNASECLQFNIFDSRITPHKTLTLTQDESFSDTYKSTSDEYICIVIELGAEPAFYQYTVNATVLQYQNVSSLQGQDLCIVDVSKMLRGSPDDSYISLELERSIFLPTKQPTCVLLSIQGARDSTVLEVSSSTLATKNNAVVLSLSVVGSLVFIIASAVIVVIILCLCLKQRCHTYVL